MAKRLENERKSTTISAFDEVGKLSWDCIEAQHLPWLEKIAIDADLQISGGRNLMDIVATSVLFSRLDKLPIAEWNADQLISWVLANHERFAPNQLHLIGGNTISDSPLGLSQDQLEFGWNAITVPEDNVRLAHKLAAK